MVSSSSSYLSWDQLVHFSKSCPMETEEQWIALHASLLKPLQQQQQQEESTKNECDTNGEEETMVEEGLISALLEEDSITITKEKKKILLLLRIQYLLVRRNYQHVLKGLSDFLLPLLLLSSKCHVQFGKAAIHATMETLGTNPTNHHHHPCSNSTTNDEDQDVTILLEEEEEEKDDSTSLLLHECTKICEDVITQDSDGDALLFLSRFELVSYLLIQILPCFPKEKEIVHQSMHTILLHLVKRYAIHTNTTKHNTRNSTNISTQKWMKPMTAMLLPALYPPPSSTATSPNTVPHFKTNVDNSNNVDKDGKQQQQQERVVELWNVLNQLMKQSVSSSKESNDDNDHHTVTHNTITKQNYHAPYIATGIWCVVMPHFAPTITAFMNNNNNNNMEDVTATTNNTITNKDLLWSFLQFCLATRQDAVIKGGASQRTSSSQLQQNDDDDGDIVQEDILVIEQIIRRRALYILRTWLDYETNNILQQKKQQQRQQKQKKKKQNKKKQKSKTSLPPPPQQQQQQQQPTNDVFNISIEKEKKHEFLVALWKKYVLCYEALEMEVEVHLIDQIWPTVLELCNAAAAAAATTTTDTTIIPGQITITSPTMAIMKWEWISSLLSRVLLTDNPSIRKWALYRFVTGDAGISITAPHNTPIQEQKSPINNNKKMKPNKNKGATNLVLEPAPLTLVGPSFVLNVLLPCYDTLGPSVGTGLQVPRKTDGQIVSDNVTPHFIQFLIQYIRSLDLSTLSQFISQILSEQFILNNIRTKTLVLLFDCIVKSYNDDNNSQDKSSSVPIDYTKKIYISSSTLENAAYSFHSLFQGNVVLKFRQEICKSLAFLLAHSTTIHPNKNENITKDGNISKNVGVLELSYSPNILLQILSLFPSPIIPQTNDESNSSEGNMDDNTLEEQGLGQWKLLQTWLSNISSHQWLNQAGAACASAYVSGQLLSKDKQTSDSSDDNTAIIEPMSKLEREMGASIVKLCTLASSMKDNDMSASAMLWPAISKAFPVQQGVSDPNELLATLSITKHWSTTMRKRATRAWVLLEYGCIECVLTGMGHGDLVMMKQSEASSDSPIMMPPPVHVEKLLSVALYFLLDQVRAVSFGASTEENKKEVRHSNAAARSGMTKSISNFLSIFIQQLRTLHKAYPSSNVIPNINNSLLHIFLDDVKSNSDQISANESLNECTDELILSKLNLVKYMSLAYAVLSCGAEYYPADLSDGTFSNNESKTDLSSRQPLLQVCSLVLNMNFTIPRAKFGSSTNHSKSKQISYDTLRAARSIFQFGKWGILSFLVPMLGVTPSSIPSTSKSILDEFYDQLFDVASDSVHATPSDSLLPLFETAVATARLQLGIDKTYFESSSAEINANVGHVYIQKLHKIVSAFFTIMEDTSHAPSRMYMLNSMCSILFRTHVMMEEYRYLEQIKETRREYDVKSDAPILCAFRKILVIAGTTRPHIARSALSYIAAAWNGDETNDNEKGIAAIPYREDIAKLLFYKEAKLDEATAHQEGLVASSVGKSVATDGKIEIIPSRTHTLSVVRTFVLVFISKLPSPNKGLSTTVLTELCHFLILWLLDNVCCKPSSKKGGNSMIMTGTEEYCEKIRAWQGLCLLSRFVTDDVADSVCSKALQSLSINLHGQIRYFAEIFCIQCARQNPSIFSIHLTKHIQRRDLTLQHAASLMVITGNIIVGRYAVDFYSCFDQSNDYRLREIIAGILPFLSSTQGFSRAIAQLLIHKLIPLVVDVKGQTNSLSIHDHGSDWYLESMWRFLDEHVEMKRLRKKQQTFFDDYDVDAVCQPEGLLGIGVDEGDEANPTHMVETIKRCLEEIYVEAHEGETPVWKQMQDLFDDVENMSLNDELEYLDDSGLVNFQRKILPLDTLNLAMDGNNQDTGRNAAGRNRQELIVCASLIDKVPNLGGLARTAEIFAADKLIIPDVGVCKMDNFKSISVGAGEWVKIEECKEKDLLSWLNQQKEAGYTIVGIEQTSSSQCLSELEFPTKTVLLLGKEKEGIPVEFLQVVDVCVEIPQLGIIRSLNVHVSGAISIWEYTKQMMTRTKK